MKEFEVDYNYNLIEEAAEETFQEYECETTEGLTVFNLEDYHED